MADNSSQPAATNFGDPPGIMTVQEAALFLRIPVSSVYKLAQEGRIPCQKVGKHWRFHREALDSWLSAAPRSGIERGLGKG